MILQIDKLNASFLNKSINFLEIKVTDPKLLKSNVHY